MVSGLFLTFILTLAIVGLAVAGFAVKIIFKKNGEFAGTCASNNPLLKNDLGECTMCGKTPEEECKMPEEH